MSLQSQYSHLLDSASDDNLILCLPDVRSIKEDVCIDETFFCQHLLHQDQDGSLSSEDGDLLAEVKEGQLRLLHGPGYHPSYSRGLHTSTILHITAASLGSREDRLRVLVVDRPLVPSYTRMGNRQGSRRQRQRAQLYRQTTVDSDSVSHEAKSRPVSAFFSRASSRLTTTTRASSAPSTSRAKLRKQKSVGTFDFFDEDSVKKSPPRQVSADSGIEQDVENNLYDLPPRMTSYEESESFLLDQVYSDHFLTHLRRLVGPVLMKLNTLEQSKTNNISREDLLLLVPEVGKVIHDSLISFPKSRCGGRSPRHQEMLSLSVENVALQCVHQELWLVVQTVLRAEDRRSHAHLATCWRRGLSVEHMGLDPDTWAVPFSPALVELAALDMRSTPLDKLTTIQDCLDQLRTQAGEISLVLEDLERDTHKEKDVAILASLLVQARPLHIYSTIFYIEHFVFSKHPDLMSSLECLKSSLSLIEKIDGRKLGRPISKMKREYNHEDLIELTEEIEMRYDRHGVSRELGVKLSSVDMFRERLAK